MADINPTADFDLAAKARINEIIEEILTSTSPVFEREKAQFLINNIPVTKFNRKITADKSTKSGRKLTGYVSGFGNVETTDKDSSGTKTNMDDGVTRIMGYKIWHTTPQKDAGHIYITHMLAQPSGEDLEKLFLLNYDDKGVPNYFQRYIKEHQSVSSIFSSLFLGRKKERQLTRLVPRVLKVSDHMYDKISDQVHKELEIHHGSLPKTLEELKTAEADPTPEP